MSLLATQASVDVIDGIVDGISVDTNELQLNQGNWIAADISALATEANATTNKNTIVGEINANETKIGLLQVDSTAILADTNELQLNQGNWIAADVSLLATQASVDVIDGIVDGILVDTNELQLNQGNWIAADVSALATEANATTNKNAIVGEIDANEVKLNTVIAKTDLIPANPAAVGSAMTLELGAITTATFSAGAIDVTVAPNLDAAVSSRSTFNNTSDEVITDNASREASKATGFAKPGHIAPLL